MSANLSHWNQKTGKEQQSDMSPRNACHSFPLVEMEMKNACFKFKRLWGFCCRTARSKKSAKEEKQKQNKRIEIIFASKIELYIF